MELARSGRGCVSRQVGKDAFRAVPQPVGLCLSVVDGDGTNGVVLVADFQLQGFFAASLGDGGFLSAFLDGGILPLTCVVYGKVLEESPFPRAGRGVKPTGICMWDWYTFDPVRG